MKRLLLIQILFLFVLLSCTEMIEQDNPYDPGGTNWDPLIVEIDSASRSVWIYDDVTIAVNQISGRTIAHTLWYVGDKSASPEKVEGTSNTFNFTKAQNGQLIVYANPVDEEGFMPDRMVSCTVTIDLGEPSVTIPSQYSVDINDTVTLRATGSDVNGTIVAYNWTGKDLDTTTTEDSIRLSFQGNSDTTVSSFTITVTPIDDDTIDGISQSTTVLVATKAPTVTAQNDTTIYVNDSVDLTALGSDINGSIIGYRWSLNDTLYTDDDDTFSTVFTTEGNYRIWVKSYDDDSIESNIDSIAVTVIKGEPTLQTQDIALLFVNDSIWLKATGFDDNGTVEGFLWSLNGTNFVEGVDSFQVAFSSAGTQTVWVKCYDDDGYESAVNTISINVTLGEPILTVQNDTTININDSLWLRVSASDVNGSVAGFRWSQNGSSFIEGVDSLHIAFASSGTKTVWVKAYDNQGLESAVKTITVTVTEGKPIVVPVRDTIVKQYDTVIVTVSAADSNSGGTIEQYYWDFNNDGYWDDSGTTQRIATPAGGVRTIVWGALDDDGVIARDTFTIRFNRPPVSSVFSFDPETKIANWSVNDPDSAVDTLNYQLEVGVDTNSYSIVYTGKLTTAAITVSNGLTYSYRLTATDLWEGVYVAKGTFETSTPPTDMKLISSKDNSFQMGSTTYSAEQPVHSVNFTYNFWMDSTEVTQEKYNSVMSEAYPGYTPVTWNDLYGLGNNYPAYFTTWYDAVLYCNALSKKAFRDTVYSYTAISGSPGNGSTLTGVTIDLNKKGYRLPTEAEWEFACRAGTSGDYYWGSSTLNDVVTQYAIYYFNSGTFGTSSPEYGAHAVASKLPNSFGLYDMSGNLLEWCNDWYGSYVSGTQEDPTGPTTGNSRAVRSGGWTAQALQIRSAFRTAMTPDTRQSTVGFRTVLLQ